MAAHILILPHPAQGHINPALAFATHLASINGLKVTFILSPNFHNQATTFSTPTSITIDHISDGSEHVKEAETIEAYFTRFEAVLSANLAGYIDRLKSSASPPKLVVYDSTMPWVLDMAKRRGLLGAPFFTQSGAFCAVFYHFKLGFLKFPYEDDRAGAALPALPPLESKDLPSFGEFMDENQTVVKLLEDQFSNLERADWIFINSFYLLEQEVLEWLESKWPIKTVGPTFLLQQKHDKFSDDDNNNNNNNKQHTISLLEAKYDAYNEWLESRETASVVYVSFGSIASLGQEQMEELAHGLALSNSYFLWVLRPSEVDKLPPGFNSEKGLIVEWCHQPRVLAHRALACFLTHCGWNSTLEALGHGVPLVAMAQWVDQNTNAKFIEDVWGVGVRVKRGENGIVGREEIAKCIEQVVGGEKSVEIRRNACQFKRLGNEAVEYGGTSANNIDDFVSKLLSS